MGGLGLLRLIGQVLVARTYLTCAARRLTVDVVSADDREPDDREIFESVDGAPCGRFAIGPGAVITQSEANGFNSFYS